MIGYYLVDGVCGDSFLFFLFGVMCFVKCVVLVFYCICCVGFIVVIMILVGEMFFYLCFCYVVNGYLRLMFLLDVVDWFL